MSDAAKRKSIAELREEAILKLEQRGYDVRGKTPGEVRQALRQRHSTKQLNTTAAAEDTT